MRSSGLFLCVTLFLCGSVLSADLVGKWSNPSITSNSGDICCIPDSITIEKSSTGWTATYNGDFSSPLANPKCWALTYVFGTKLSISEKMISGTYGASVSAYGASSEMFTYKLETSNNTLNVQFSKAYTAYTSTCNFTMNTYNGSNSTLIVVIVIILLVLVCVLIFKKNQNKQVNLINQANPGFPNTGYAAPNTFNPQYPQGYPQYPQQYPQGYPQQYPQAIPQAIPQANTQINPQDYSQPAPQANGQIQTQGYPQLPAPQANA